MSQDNCWVVTDGKPGMVSQALGLAEAVGLPIVDKRIVVRAPWRWLPPQLWLYPFAALSASGDRLDPPWPRLLIGCGRMSVPLSIAVRRASGGRTFTVQLQDPKISARLFDLVVPPRHDRFEAPNAIVSRGALHRLTPARLTEEADRFRERLAHLPRPLVAVLLGGSNTVYRFDAEQGRQLGEGLAAMAAASGAGLAVTPSRRTDPDGLEALRSALGETPAEIWDGTGENPYFGYLGLADAIVATCDSVSMVSEACATGKPVHIYSMPGNGPKFDDFHDGLRRDGLTRPFEGRLEQWNYAPLNDTAEVAAAVRARLNSGARD